MADEYPEIGEAEPARAPSSRRLSRISTRILSVVLLSTLLTALVISGIALDAIERQVSAELELRFARLLDTHGARLERQLLDARDALAESLADVAPNRLASLREPELAALLDRHPAFDALVLAREGRMLAAAGQLDDAGAGIASLRLAPSPGRAPLDIDLRDSAVGPKLTATIGADPAADGAPFVVAVYRLAPLREALRLLPDESAAELALVDRDGRLFATAGEHDADRADAADSPVPDEATLTWIRDSDGTLSLASVRALPGTPLALRVAAPLDAVYAPLLSVGQRILVFDVAILLLFGLLGWRVTSAIVRPIEALTEGALRISRGDVARDIPAPPRRDEIGLLTQIFNDMLQRLRSSQAEIEQDQLRLTAQNEELQRANEVLAQLSITDGLTRLHNHRFFQDHLTREIKRVDRTGEPLSMLLLDLDDFKRLNDRHGHAAGDEVLMNLAGRLNENVRQSDLLARYGGEEFVILAPNTDLAGATSLAEKIRMSVESMPQIIDASLRPVRVTLSCGVAQYDGDRKHFFQAADRALYRAKAGGKNCVVAAGEDD